MLIYAERGLAACLEHSSLFKVNLNQLLMPEDRSPPRRWERGSLERELEGTPSPGVWGRDNAVFSQQRDGVGRGL
jgi:hypothetical protein